jgi:maleamate amidohydrolase
VSSEDTRSVYQRSGIGHRAGFGDRPALVVVDLQNGFTDPACPVGGELGDVLAASASVLGGSRWCEIDDRVAPAAGDPVYVKRASSAFFGTPLLTFLTARRVDTLVVVGCVTSGCVRATTIDAVSYGFRTIVPEQCVGDRAEAPHATNLFDIDAKYADVLALDEVLESLQRIAGERAPQAVP